MTHGSGGEPPSTPEAAKDVASTAVDRGGQVAQTAAEEVKHVAAHAQHEARDLLGEAREQLESQARDGQHKAAQSLHELAGQLDRMAEQTDSPGVASDVVRQVSGRTRTVADWLEHREPGDLLDEVRRFARRRPGAFLAGAVVAGALVGRLTRGVVAQQQEPSGDTRPDQPAPHPGPAATTPIPSAAPQHALPQPGGAAPPAALPQPSGPGVPAAPPVAPAGYTAPQVPESPAPGGGAGFTEPGPVRR
ncbi:hypothetical protein VA596_46940 [Amycolatopsis sp., V23-08]|uniref:DUF3618 domain-containing protein n=1 Tax=Amycolatopsis heterodermiae TaxID=3110235 RepID=A0ABU5RNU5_9PSEU|nr:hypothetical protein [Amycolatopsis sp., V23-08]MEA5367135.1 hypothetical protein [Amycolatopsis sp., V23-08]